MAKTKLFACDDCGVRCVLKSIFGPPHYCPYNGEKVHWRPTTENFEKTLEGIDNNG